MDNKEITRPKHYGGTDNPHEPIAIIEHYGLGFCLGNVIKYVLRSDKKGQEVEDLMKAIFYLQRHLDKVKIKKKDYPTFED